MKRAHIKIHGIVQGVGFRPFIHKLVRLYALRGYIANTSSGVELELEGERKELERFISDVPLKAPKLALIEKIETEWSEELRNFPDFEIRLSKTESSRNTLISPDVCICDDCLNELNTPSDRRYRYPFINCTNCGPRFTIIKDVPYDRVKTSMGSFPMCPDCDREYHDIEDRRYHAQPDCCPDCGPHIFFLDSEKGASLSVLTEDGDCADVSLPVGESAMAAARELIKNGGILAVKGLGGMHLACSADSPEIALELRRRKQRDEKPFALMCRDVEAAKKLCFVSPEEEKILSGFRRPIVLLKKRVPGYGHISENGYIGIMLPYTPLHYLLFGNDIDTLIMTSANLSDTPIMFKNGEALERLKGIADGFLLHNRDIQTRCDDSLCWVFNGYEYFARRSRGYVPFPVTVPLLENAPMLLALGAEQKASFCLSKGSYAFPSQHIGDLKNMETFSNYCNQVSHFRRLFDINPSAVACDLHPDYMSTEYAQSLGDELGIPVVRVQHHHAHMAACMADNGLSEPVIGMIWDGTGLGTDGTVWGGECLIGDYSGFRRFGNIRPIPLPGGDLCTKESSRVALSLLMESGCDVSEIENREVLSKMLEKGINCPLSSGMGRLFDGVSAILNIKNRCSYEGQGAILLEAAGASEMSGCNATFPVAFTREGGRMVYDWRPMVRELTKLKSSGENVSVLAAMFMNTLVDMALEQCSAAREETGIEAVCLSGGSFQNMYILSRLTNRLSSAGFRVFTHRRVSPNDEGLSLGQLVIAAAEIQKQ